jgi:hypothetical protein
MLKLLTTNKTMNYVCELKREIRSAADNTVFLNSYERYNFYTDKGHYEISLQTKGKKLSMSTLQILELEQMNIWKGENLNG